MRREAASFGPNIAQVEFHNIYPNFNVTNDPSELLTDTVVQSRRTGIPITTKVRISDTDGVLTDLARQARTFSRIDADLRTQFAHILHEEGKEKPFFEKVRLFVQKKLVIARLNMLPSQIREIKEDALEVSKKAVVRELDRGAVVMAEKKKWLEFEPVEGVERGDLRQLVHLAKGVWVFIFAPKNPESSELEMIKDCVLM